MEQNPFGVFLIKINHIVINVLRQGAGRVSTQEDPNHAHGPLADEQGHKHEHDKVNAKCLLAFLSSVLIIKMFLFKRHTQGNRSLGPQAQSTGSPSIALVTMRILVEAF